MSAAFFWRSCSFVCTYMLKSRPGNTEFLYLYAMPSRCTTFRSECGYLQFYISLCCWGFPPHFFFGCSLTVLTCSLQPSWRKEGTPLKAHSSTKLMTSTSFEWHDSTITKVTITRIQRDCCDTSLSQQALRVSEDVLCAVHDCSLEISPVLAYSDVKRCFSQVASAADGRGT